jgi:hypothetical protein
MATKIPKLLQPKKKKVILVVSKKQKPMLTPAQRARIIGTKKALA